MKATLRTTTTAMLAALMLGAAANAEMVTIRLGTPAALPAAGARRRAQRPTAYAIEAKTAPKADGKLDEGVWAKARAMKLARTLDGSGAAAQPTEVRLCRRDKVLYLAVRCVEPLIDKLRATRRGHDGGIWSDDSIEIFIGFKGQYWHFGINAVGSTYDGKGKDGGWNAGAGFRAAAGRGKSEWTLEVAIPLTAMSGRGELPTEWILNVCRNRQASGRMEEAAWSPTFSGNSHLPERFGRLLLKAPPVEQKEVVEKEDLKIIPTETGQGVLQFDLADLPKGATVHRADLLISRTAKVDGQFDEALVDVEVYPLLKAFDGKGTPAVAGKPLAIRGPRFDRLDATDAVRQWAGGKTNGGFFIKSCPFINAAATCLDIAYEGRPDPKKLPPQVTGVKAFHRSGQTFITWKEVTDPVKRDEIQWGALKMILDDLDRKQRLRYVVYRHTEPITAGNLHQARPIAAVKPGSAWNVNGRSIERGIDWNLANKYAHMHGHWNPFGHASMDGEWGRECPIDRLAIADGEDPKRLARTTGLYVHTAASPGSAHYAVVTRIDGVENTLGISPANTAGPVGEGPSEPQPVFQGELPPMPFWNYREKRLHYVRWVTEPYANLPSQYYNWSVAVPTRKIHDKFALTLNLHSWARSYWRTPYRIERDSIVVVPHDFPLQTWWYGYNSSYGTLKSFRTGAVQPYTERRVLWFLDWVMKKWPVNRGRVLVTSTTHKAAGPGFGGDGSGCSGAMHLALRHPELFNACLTGGANVNYAAGPKGTMQAIWGKVNWALKTADGKSVWDELDLPRLVDAHKPGTDMPLVTFIGRNVPPDTSALIGALLGKGGAVLAFYDQWPTGRLIPVSATGTWPSPMIRMDIRKNRLLPTFSRSSGKTFRAGPPRYPKLNLGFRFDAGSIVDKPGRIEVALYGAGRYTSGSADVTLTRVQSFKVVPGRKYAWQIGGRSGEVTAGDDGLITIPGCPIPKSPTKLIVTPK